MNTPLCVFTSPKTPSDNPPNRRSVLRVTPPVVAAIARATAAASPASFDPLFTNFVNHDDDDDDVATAGAFGVSSVPFANASLASRSARGAPSIPLSLASRALATRSPLSIPAHVSSAPPYISPPTNTCGTDRKPASADDAARSAAASSTLISSNAIPASPSALFARLQCGHDDVPTTVTDVAPSVVAARARDAARVDA